LVKMMGGDLWVHSEVGKGSQFCFTVRLGVGDAKTIETAAIAPAEMLRGVKVLVVDDSPTNLKILEAMLNRWDMKPTLAEGGEQALAELARSCEAGRPYSVILTDVHMPKMDGFGLVERIRKMPEFSTATIMMLTSAGQQGDAVRCRELGVAAYLLKPVRKSDLRDAIARVLGVREPTGAVQPKTAMFLQAGRASAVCLRVLLAEDNPVNQLFVQRLLEKRGHSVVVASTGLEALDILQRENVDVVLMDIQMPEMDGLEATKAIRSRESDGRPRMPVIALTAHAMKGDREKCLAAGMDAHLSKPIRPAELDEVLEKYMARRTESAKAHEPADQSK
jgi:CheY-like chemotaxis protein